MISVSIFILWAHRAATFLQIQDSEPWDAYYETLFFSESSSSDVPRTRWSMGSILVTLTSAEGKGGKPAWLLRNCFSAAPLLKVRGCFFIDGTQATHVGGQQLLRGQEEMRQVCSQESWATTGLATQGDSFFSFSTTPSDCTLKQSLPPRCPQSTCVSGAAIPWAV